MRLDRDLITKGGRIAVPLLVAVSATACNLSKPEYTPTPESIRSNPVTDINPSLTPSPTMTPNVSFAENIAQAADVAVTQTEEAAPQSYSNPETVSSFHIPYESMMTVNENGIARLDINKFRDYFKNTLANKGKDANGKTIDFMANMLATNPEAGDLFLGHGLNFWFGMLGGLGWTGDEKVYADRGVNGESELRSSILDANGNLKDVFTHGTDGKLRYADVIQAKDFESAIARAATLRYLDGAGMLGKSKQEIVNFLNDPKVDAEIHNLVNALIGTEGIQALAQDANDPNQIVNWPGSRAILFDGDANFFSDTLKVCLANMAKAKDRDSQRETSVQIFYHFGLEANSPDNDETMTNSDSNGDIIMTVTYDPESKASSGGSLSPNEKGTMRIDIFRVSAITDEMARQQIAEATGKEVFYVPPTDSQAGVLYWFDGSRLVPCAIPKPKPTQVAPTTQPAQEIIINNPISTPENHDNPGCDKDCGNDTTEKSGPPQHDPNEDPNINGQPDGGAKDTGSNTTQTKKLGKDY